MSIALVAIYVLICKAGDQTRPMDLVPIRLLASYFLFHDRTGESASASWSPPPSGRTVRIARIPTAKRFRASCCDSLLRVSEEALFNFISFNNLHFLLQAFRRYVLGARKPHHSRLIAAHAPALHMAIELIVSHAPRCGAHRVAVAYFYHLHVGAPGLLLLLLGKGRPGQSQGFTNFEGRLGFRLGLVGGRRAPPST